MLRKTNSQVEIAYGFIRDQIISYTLAPGAPISDYKFSKALNVSRTTIREAILLLQIDGLIRVNEAGKVIVAPIQLEDIVDILHVRSALESEAIRKIAAAGWLTSAQESELSTLCIQMSESAAQNEASEHYKYDDLFHSRLVGFAGSLRICEILDHMRLQMQRARWLNIVNPQRHSTATLEHGELLSALSKHDLEQAVHLLRLHFVNSEEAFRRILKDKQLQTFAAVVNSFHP